jgi:hypothetical protein
MNEAGMELPRYKCHKEVSAAKITGMAGGNGGVYLNFGEINSEVFVSNDWIDRFKAEVGGYFVVYNNGYQSFSPAKAFEEGYTKI